MRVFPERPGIEEEAPEARKLEPAVRTRRVTHRVLHERVGGDDEIAGEPGTEEQRQRGREVAARAQAFFAEEEEPKEGRLEKESEDALHRQRRPDDAAGELRETRPVGAELELERNARHYADGEVDPEDAPPETRRFSGALISAQRGPLENHDQERQPHRELGEQIVVRDGETELDPMPEERIRGGSHERSAPTHRLNRWRRRDQPRRRIPDITARIRESSAR